MCGLRGEDIYRGLSLSVGNLMAQAQARACTVEDGKWDILVWVLRKQDMGMLLRLLWKRDMGHCSMIFLICGVGNVGRRTGNFGWGMGNFGWRVGNCGCRETGLVCVCI